MRGLSAKTWMAVAALALLAVACGGSESSGLATLEGTATTAAPVDPAAVEPVSEPTAVTQADAEAAEAAEASSSAVTEAGSVDSDETAVEGKSESEGAGGGESGSEAADEGAESQDTADKGSSGSEDVADDGSAGSEDLTDEERLLEFAQCMRDNGVDFPDPVVEADGTVTFGFRPGGGGDPNLLAARDACSGLLEGLAFGPGQGGFDLVELQDTLLEFAQCMRDNGVDMGDPDLRDFIPGSGDDGQPATPFGDIDFSDPDLLSAFQTCQQLVSLATPRFGGNG